MEKEQKMTRRDFLKIALAGTGTVLLGASVVDYLNYLSQEIHADNSPPQGVETLKPIQNAATPEKPIDTPINTPEVPENTPNKTPEPTPMVNNFKIAEKIDLSNGDPMKWLLVTKNQKAILTPSAKAYAYSVENEKNNIFDWRKNTTYTYLEENNIPVVWGHSGLPELFFDHWADILRKPGEGGNVVTREEAQKAMIENIIGSEVYLFQATKENILPESAGNPGSIDPLTKVVKAKVIAGLLVPRWQLMSYVDLLGNPTDQSQVVFDGKGVKVDFVSNAYNKHTSDVIRWIKNVYPDDSRDVGQTNKLFSSLPKSDVLIAKFCIRPFSDDLAAPQINSGGQSVTSISYGRVVLVLEIQKT